MKTVRWFWTMLLVGMLVFGSMSVPRIYAQGPKKTPPGQAKKQNALPPGLSKKDQLPQGLADRDALPPGLAKRDDIPGIKVKDELKQAWCLEREGTVNFVLPEKVRCDCVLESQVVVFTEEDEWTEAVGRVLYVAMKLEKEATIVAFEEVDRTQLYIARLNRMIEYFGLPITVSTLPLSAEIQDKIETEEREDAEQERATE